MLRYGYLDRKGVMERTVAKVCGGCSGPLKFVVTQARCIDRKCPMYWQGQGGIETLDPIDQQPPPSQPNAAVVVLPPETL